MGRDCAFTLRKKAKQYKDCDNHPRDQQQVVYLPAHGPFLLKYTLPSAGLCRRYKKLQPIQSMINAQAKDAKPVPVFRQGLISSMRDNRGGFA